MKEPPTPTSSFLSLLAQLKGHSDIKKLRNDQLQQLDHSSENVMIETINSIGAIGDLLYWSFNTEEPPVENVGQIGILLRSLSDLLIEADFVRSEVGSHLIAN